MKKHEFVTRLIQRGDVLLGVLHSVLFCSAQYCRCPLAFVSYKILLKVYRLIFSRKTNVISTNLIAVNDKFYFCFVFGRICLTASYVHRANHRGCHIWTLNFSELHALRRLPSSIGSTFLSYTAFFFFFYILQLIISFALLHIRTYKFAAHHWHSLFFLLSRMSYDSEIGWRISEQLISHHLMTHRKSYTIPQPQFCLCQNFSILYIKKKILICCLSSCL